MRQKWVEAAESRDGQAGVPTTCPVLQHVPGIPTTVCSGRDANVALSIVDGRYFGHDARGSAPRVPECRGAKIEINCEKDK